MHRKIRVNFNLRSDKVEALKAHCDKNGLTYSAVIETLITNWLRECDPEFIPEQSMYELSSDDFFKRIEDLMSFYFERKHIDINC